MTMPFDPATSVDSLSSAEQNIQLQPSSYQPAQTAPTPAPSSTSTAGSTSSSTSSTSGSGSTDSVQISYSAQVKQLNSQGMSAADIAQTMGSTIASVDTLLNITPTTIPSTTPTASTSTSTPSTVSL